LVFSALLAGRVAGFFVVAMGTLFPAGLPLSKTLGTPRSSCVASGEGSDHEIGRASSGQYPLYIGHVVGGDPVQRILLAAAMLVPSLPEAPLQFVAWHVDENGKVKQRGQPRPWLLVEQKVIALHQDEPAILADKGGCRTRQFHAAVENGYGDFRLAGAYALQQRLKSGEVESFRRALAPAQAAPLQNGIVEVKSVHWHNLGTAFRQQVAQCSGQGGLAGCRRPGNGNDQPSGFSGPLEYG